MQARNGSMSNRPEMDMKRVLICAQDALEPDDLRYRPVFAKKLLQESGQIGLRAIGAAPPAARCAEWQGVENIVLPGLLGPNGLLK